MPSIEERFLSKTKRARSGCLNWVGAINRKGYGLFGMHGKSVAAHRVSHRLFKGPIPKHKMVLHTCDNRRCVEPMHLWIGTAKDNAQDCLNKGRWAKNFAENNGQHKLSKREVAFIKVYRYKTRKLYFWGAGLLAKKFNVSHSTIQAIANGKKRVGA